MSISLGQDQAKAYVTISVLVAGLLSLLPLSPRVVIICRPDVVYVIE